jgi:hypothetical protein
MTPIHCFGNLHSNTRFYTKKIVFRNRRDVKPHYFLVHRSFRSFHICSHPRRAPKHLLNLFFIFLTSLFFGADVPLYQWNVRGAPCWHLPVVYKLPGCRSLSVPSASPETILPQRIYFLCRLQGLGKAEKVELRSEKQILKSSSTLYRWHSNVNGNGAPSGIFAILLCGFHYLGREPTESLKHHSTRASSVVLRECPEGIRAFTPSFVLQSILGTHDL